ncbi:Chaperone protein DnaJ [Diplonema papillatum]|nr:Chaperone protein DnaJ [Diplonema papillatum]
MVGDHYATLGLCRRASDQDIKDAYRRKARLYHPDKNSGSGGEQFKKVHEAYQVLKDRRLRTEYDEKRCSPNGPSVWNAAKAGGAHYYAPWTPPPVSVSEILRSDHELRRKTSGRTLTELLEEQRLCELQQRRQRGVCLEQKKILEAILREHPHLARDVSLQWRDEYETLTDVEEAERRGIILAELANYIEPTRLEMYRLFLSASKDVLSRTRPYFSAGKRT